MIIFHVLVNQRPNTDDGEHI